MIYVTRRVVFAAAHRLFNPTFTDEKNEEVFDKCNNLYGHGHNYTLEVTVAGKPDPETGYVIDLKDLKRIIKKNVFEKVDHKHLNHDVDFLKGYITSIENLIVLFWKELENKFEKGQKLHKLKLWETENNVAEYFGDEVELNKFDNA